MKKKSYNFIDLFSGCGGFSCGLELAGHKCLLGVDRDQNALQTFLTNHPHAQIYANPIETLDRETLLKLVGKNTVELVVGGPPCQGFSTVGKGKANDQRNSLFIHFVKVVSWLKPKIIILENVTGLLAKKNSQVLNNIFKQFESQGYSMSARLLRAEDFGAPTQRRRTFIVGTLGINPELVFPLNKSSQITVGLAWEYWLKNKDGIILNHQTDKTQITNKMDLKRIKCIPAGEAIRYQKDEDKFFTKKIKLSINWKELPEKRLRQKKYHRLDKNKIAPTIMTSSRTYYHPSENRYLTIREVAALQSFPPSFLFKGSYTSMYRQIGNAVPPLIAKAIGEKIAELNFTIKSKFKSKKINVDKIRSSAFSYLQESN